MSIALPTVRTGGPEDAEGLYDTFWERGETLQLAGKDQVRFQSIMWQAMLMSAGRLQAPRGQVVIGRDAARASLVITHGAVSGQHAVYDVPALGRRRGGRGRKNIRDRAWLR